MSLPWEEGGFLEANAARGWLETTYLHKEAPVNRVSVPHSAQRNPSSSLSACGAHSSQMPGATLTPSGAREE